MQHTLTTTGGQFSAHHVVADHIPDEIHFYLGQVRALGSPRGTWLIYEHVPDQPPDQGQQLYEYDCAMQLRDPRTSELAVPEGRHDHIHFQSDTETHE